jgi:rhodanese-related sulfurtransferase
MKQITPAELAAWLGEKERTPPLLLDVREPWEHDKARIEGARLVPMGELPARIGELDPGREIVAICHHGGRSCRWRCSSKNGFANVHICPAAWTLGRKPSTRPCRSTDNNMNNRSPFSSLGALASPAARRDLQVYRDAQTTPSTPARATPRGGPRKELARPLAAAAHAQPHRQRHRAASNRIRRILRWCRASTAIPGYSAISSP